MNGFAVRREWSTGDHDFVQFTVRPKRPAGFIARDAAYWRRGPIRPVEYQVVPISRHDFTLHNRCRRWCRAPDCPTGPVAASIVRRVTA